MTNPFTASLKLTVGTTFRFMAQDMIVMSIRKELHNNTVALVDLYKMEVIYVNDKGNFKRMTFCEEEIFALQNNIGITE